MPGKSRMVKINDELLRELSKIIHDEIKDPRVSAMTSVLKVDTSSDLKYCKAYISVLGNDDQKANVMEGLKNAQGFIRKLVAERVNLRNTPEIKFLIDDSLEHGMRISKLIDDVMLTQKASDDTDISSNADVTGEKNVLSGEFNEISQRENNNNGN